MKRYRELGDDMPVLDTSKINAMYIKAGMKRMGIKLDDEKSATRSFLKIELER